MQTQQNIAFQKLDKLIGKQIKCLIDFSDDSNSSATGRYYGQAPEIDSHCLIEQCTAGTGDFIDAEVVAGKGYDIAVKQISR